MRVHRPLVGIFIAYVLGILAADWISWPDYLLFWGGVVSAVASLMLRRSVWASGLVVLALIFLGAMAAQNHATLSRQHIARTSRLDRSGEVVVEGVIVSDVEERSFFRGQKTVFTLEVKNLWTSQGMKRKEGKLLVNVFRKLELQYGDFIQLQGKLHAPYHFSTESRFDYRDYLKQRGIHLILSVKKKNPVEVLESNQGNRIKAISLKNRKRFKQILNDYLPVDSRGIMNALLLGERYDIPKALKDLFVQTGTAHILAISGFNVGIVAFLVFLFLKLLRFPRRWQFIWTIVVIIFYALLTGAQSPVVRATIMTTIFLASFLVEREVNPLNSLALAGMIILLGSPAQIYDVGFQLSFVSVLFILILYPRLQRFFLKKEDEDDSAVYVYFMQSLLVSVAASIGVTALIAYYFQIVTPISILANLIIIPLTSLNIALGLGLLLFGTFFPYLAHLFAVCIQFFIQLMIMITALLSEIPGAYFNLGNLSLGWILGYYLFLSLLMNAQRIKNGLNSKNLLLLYLQAKKLNSRREKPVSGD